MDTLGAWRAFWRNRALTVPVTVVGALAILYLAVLYPASYRVSSTLLMVPPPPPTAVAGQEPEGGSGPAPDRDNPYARRYDPNTMFNIVAARVDTERGRAAVRRLGGTGDFEVHAVTNYGTGTPLATVRTDAGSPADAVLTNEVVIATLQRELDALQRKELSDERFFVTTEVVVPPVEEDVVRASPVRAVAAVLAVAVLLLFGLVAVGDAVRAGRRPAWRRPEQSPSAWPAARDVPRPAQQDRTTITGESR